LKSHGDAEMGRNKKTLGLFVLLWFFASGCQSEPQIVTVGVFTSIRSMTPVLEGFKSAMSDLGYKEGENIEYLFSGPVELSELEEEVINFVNLDVDLILALSTAAAAAAKEATAESGIPVVFVPVTDPLGTGIVDSLQSPGGNLTGVTNGGSESRRMEWLIKLAPEVQILYMPFDTSYSSRQPGLAIARDTAVELGLTLIEEGFADEESMQAAIPHIPTEAQAIFLLPDPSAINLVDEYVAATIERGLPMSAPTITQVEAGALVSFGIDFFEAGKQAARLAGQIIRQDNPINPADLPIEQGEFFLNINLATARAIGIEIPDSILDQANGLIR
jgi:putative ABC transport system substrate-binding protein